MANVRWLLLSLDSDLNFFFLIYRAPKQQHVLRLSNTTNKQRATPSASRKNMLELWQIFLVDTFRFFFIFLAFVIYKLRLLLRWLKLNNIKAGEISNEEISISCKISLLSSLSLARPFLESLSWNFLCAIVTQPRSLQFTIELNSSTWLFFFCCCASRCFLPSERKCESQLAKNSNELSRALFFSVHKRRQNRSRCLVLCF